jgi:hypothetical protein
MLKPYQKARCALKPRDPVLRAAKCGLIVLSETGFFGTNRMRTAAFLALILCLSTAAVCNAQNSQTQSATNPSTASPADKGGVLEIAPETPPPAPSAPPPAASPQGQHGSAAQNPQDQNSANSDIELYRTYTDSEHAAGKSGPMPYLGISVHSVTVTQPNGSQQEALEVLSVDKGSPAAAAGIKGSGAPTELGATSLTASALFGPAQELVAPLLQKTGQLGRQGDLIVAVDNDRVSTEQDLAGELAHLKPGDTLWLTVLRATAKGKPHAVNVPIKLASPQGTTSASAVK